MASTDMNQLENSIQAAIVRASGLPAASVYWQRQNVDRPPPPFVAIWTLFDTRIGTPENTVADNPDSTLGDGEEIVLTSRSEAEFEVVLDAVSSVPVSTPSEESAQATLHRVRQGLESEGVMDFLASVGLVLVRCGAVAPGAKVLQTQFQGEATLTVVFRVSDEFTELTTFIESAEAVGTYT